jgi:hypothetical protein
MTAVVVLVTAEELAAGRVVLPPQIEPCPDCHRFPTPYDCTFCDGSTGERTVSQTLPESQCPNPRCVEGRIFLGASMKDCPECEGRGSLAVVHLAIEQWRTEGTEKWSMYQWEPPRERRQAIVGYVTPTVLRVTDESSSGEYPYIVVDPLTDSVMLLNGPALDDAVDLLDTDEDTYLGDRWAQGLVPGSVVLEWDTVTPIDPPIVEMPCDDYDTCTDPDTYDDGLHPLSLGQGQLTEVNVDE